MIVEQGLMIVEVFVEYQNRPGEQKAMTDFNHQQSLFGNHQSNLHWLSFLTRQFMLILPLITLLVGCGDNGGRVPVTGVVTFDGKPLEDGNITFGGDQGAAGIGKIVNGSFSLSETGNETGVLPGNYTVIIGSWFEERGTVMANGAFSPGKTRIPLIYLEPDQSGLVAEVKQGTKNHFTFELTSDVKKGGSDSSKK